jgi:hypothetical protein
MSVMLQTTNPEAVGAMEPGRDRRVPYQGQVLVYHMRPGEGRGGKITAPAIVTRVEDDDHCEVMIIHAADDFITRWKVPRKTEQNPCNAWAFSDHDEKHYAREAPKEDAPIPHGRLTWEDVKAMHAEVATLRNKVAGLEAASPAQRQHNQPQHNPQRGR